MTWVSRAIISAALIFAGIIVFPSVARCQIAENDEPKNEFGLWAGYSPVSLQVIGITTERQLGLLSVRYARTLWENHFASFQWTIDVLPLELMLQPKFTKVVSTTSPPEFFFVPGHREYVYGGGINPIGPKLNFFRSHRLQPFIASSAGFVASVKRIPVDVPGGTLFNFTFDFQAGFQYYNSSHSHAWMLGSKLHHISNAFRTNVNPGVDSIVIFVGYSFFR